MLRRTRLDEHVDQRRDGTPRTVADAICDHLTAGLHLSQAAALVGASPNAVTAWLTEGARMRMANVRRRDMTMTQRLSADFHQAAELALATCEARDMEALDQLARGGMRLTTTSEKQVIWTDDDGEVHTSAVERTTTTKVLAPDLKAITWRMQRRWPERYFQPEVAITSPLPTAQDAERSPAAMAVAEARRMVEREREVRAALEPGVIDAVVVDERPLRLDDDHPNGDRAST